MEIEVPPSRFNSGSIWGIYGVGTRMSGHSTDEGQQRLSANRDMCYPTDDIFIVDIINHSRTASRPTAAYTLAVARLPIALLETLAYLPNGSALYFPYPTILYQDNDSITSHNRTYTGLTCLIPPSETDKEEEKCASLAAKLV